MDLCLTVVDRTAGSLIKLQGCRENDSRQVRFGRTGTSIEQNRTLMCKALTTFLIELHNLDLMLMSWNPCVCPLLPRNGNRLSPTRSFVTWAATSVWTAAAPGWADSLWRSAARASTSNGSSPSIYNHRGCYRPREDWDIGKDTNRLWGLQNVMEKELEGKDKTWRIDISLSLLLRGAAGPVYAPLPHLKKKKQQCGRGL